MLTWMWLRKPNYDYTDRGDKEDDSGADSHPGISITTDPLTYNHDEDRLGAPWMIEVVAGYWGELCPILKIMDRASEELYVLYTL